MNNHRFVKHQNTRTATTPAPFIEDSRLLQTIERVHGKRALALYLVHRVAGKSAADALDAAIAQVHFQEASTAPGRINYFRFSSP